MNLQTKISIRPQQHKIDYNAEVMLLGSCFAENIGNKFDYFKFQNLQNPFGILFHPKAIETYLWMTTQQEEYTEADLFFYNDIWHCFDAHSSLSSEDKHRVIQNLNKGLQKGFDSLTTASHLIITLGTSWVYKLKELDMVVANCHKVPQREFDKELLSVEEIVQNLQNCIQMVKSMNPRITIVFTVSPVRHLKDGMVENNQSKAHLLTAIHQVIDTNSGLHYFPSYEIMLDELRDYRFYKNDMIHPSSLAIEYIWNRFAETWVAESASDIMNKVDEIQKGLQHRPFNPQSENHLSFLQKLNQKKETIQRQFPFMSFS